MSSTPSRRALLTHRRCSREYAAYVELHAGDRRAWLPRWHQADRGPDREPYAHHETAPEGAYAKIPIWSSRDHWLQVVVPLVIADARRQAPDGQLRTKRPDPADKRPGSPVSEKLLRRYLTLRSAYADQRTGRRCIVRPETLASVLDVDQGTVHRCQNVARSLGLEQVVAMGRMLTFAERMTLWRDAKRDRVRPSRQRGLSTEVAFTDPCARRRHLWTAPPDRGSALKTNLHQITSHVGRQAAASGRRNRAASPRKPRNAPAWHVQARPIAQELAQILPWLRSERLGRLLPMLKRFVDAEEPWTAAQLVDAIDDHQARNAGGRPTRSITLLEESRIRSRPAVLLAALLRKLDVTDDWTPPTVTGRSIGPDNELREVEVCRCTHTDCDHGWLTPDPADPWAPLRRCPVCIATCRHSADPDSAAYQAGGSYDEPPF